jgi:hypothetical protein
MPSTGSGVSAATHPGCPVPGGQLMHVQVGGRARDHRQQRHTSGGRPPDPPHRPAFSRPAPKDQFADDRRHVPKRQLPLGHEPAAGSRPAENLPRSYVYLGRLHSCLMPRPRRPGVLGSD